MRLSSRPENGSRRPGNKNMGKRITTIFVLICVLFPAYVHTEPSDDWSAGMNYFYAQDYENAVKYLGKAFAAAPSEERKNFLDFASATRDATKDFLTFENEKFVLRLHPDDKILNFYAFEALDAAYDILGGGLGYFPNHKVTVEVYPTAESFNVASSLSKRDMETSGAIGICKFNKIMMLSPRCLAFGFRWMDTLTHEYTHYLIMEKTRNNCPLWLHEGIAKYCETLWRAAPAGKSLFLTPQSKNLLSQNKDKLISFSRMSPSLVKLNTQEEVALAFAEVSLAVDRIGLPDINKILSALGGGADIDGAFKKVLGKDVAEFEAVNSSYIAHAGFDETPGAVLDSTKLKSPGVDEVSEFVPLDAANYISLGDRFVENGMIPAAAEEYRKAEQVEPNNPVVLNKLAKILFSQGSVEDAILKVKKAAAANPNYVPSYTNLGNFYFYTGRYGDAASYYEQSNQINPFNPLIHKNMAGCYEQLKSEKKAEQEYSVVRDLIF